MKVRRGIGLVVGTAAIAASLSGCLFAIDAAKPEMRLENDSSQDVVVFVEGLTDENPYVVDSQGWSSFGASECVGTGIRVETESGDLLGRVEEQACPDWTLTINNDGSLDYVED